MTWPRNTAPSKRGGRRPNQTGRPPSGGRKYVTRSVAMLPEDWERLDRLRGELSRGRWIAERLLTQD